MISGNVTFQAFMGSVDSISWVERIVNAWEQKRQIFVHTAAFRIVNGVYSGVPGLAVDWYDGHIVLFAYSPVYGGLTKSDILPLVAKLQPKSLTLKDRTDKAGDHREPSRLLWGDVPERIMVSENGIRFWVEMAHPHNVGLFLDTRDVRQWLRQNASGRILNLFSYTCSLGLAAGFGGAETVNVDISKRYLEWGRDNYQINELKPEATAFKSMPAERYLDWAHKKGLGYDGIILDPPSFARFDGNVFSLTKDYGRLVEKCARILNPNGFLLAMTNYSEASPQRLQDWISSGLVRAGWKGAEWFPVLPGGDFDPPPVWRQTEEGMLSGWRIVRKVTKKNHNSL
jgi:23S rRNA (cytosine1962-C5)-methyltransferase